MDEKDSCTMKVGPFFCSCYVNFVDDDAPFRQYVRFRYIPFLRETLITMTSSCFELGQPISISLDLITARERLGPF